MEEHKLALIVAYYLSRFNKDGLGKLGFSSFNEAFEIFAQKLNVKKNYIKLSRDEFDPVFPWRRGWQRPMDKRIKKAIDAFQDLSESDLRVIVLKILNDSQYRTCEELQEITSIFSEVTNNKDKKGQFILRAPTGKQAEEFFIKYFLDNKKPINGKLIDCRDLGVGYDFIIESKEKNFYIEVKGITNFAGGILFTSKEWAVAEKEKNNYFLCVISNLGELPKIIFVQNPFIKLNPKRNVYTSIQISWSVTQNQLDQIND